MGDPLQPGELDPQSTRSSQRALRWLGRGEIILLALVYAYFVLTDRVPLVAFALIALLWLARWRVTGALTRCTPFDLPILLLLAWLPITLSVTIDPALSLPKLYGIVLCVAFFYAIVNAMRTPRDLEFATLWLVIVCAGIALASEAEILAAMRLIWERLKLVVEPSGAVPLAALLRQRERFAGLRVGVILSGGNVDLDALPGLLALAP